MLSKTALLVSLILIISSCKDGNKKKDVIVGMDEGVDSIVAAKFPLTKPDAVFRDTSKKRNILNHDSAFRNHKMIGPGLKNIPVFNGATDLKQFIVEIKQLVAVNNKQEIAKRIKYPLNNSIKTISDFYANYDKLFTAKVKSALAGTNVENLPRNQQTIMIANGKILIAREGNGFKIIRINN